jgi:peptide-methionine (R)-S-oxide reductase
MGDMAKDHKRIFELLTGDYSFLFRKMETQENDKDDKEELKERLTPEQYEVCMCSATEPPFTGKYWNCTETGTYTCICCGIPLFASESKFDSGTGWPSFWDTIDPEVVGTKEDSSQCMVRVEIVCKKCDSHLGHVFKDGPPPTGLRYCVNSASLDLVQE